MKRYNKRDFLFRKKSIIYEQESLFHPPWISILTCQALSGRFLYLVIVPCIKYTDFVFNNFTKAELE